MAVILKVVATWELGPWRFGTSKLYRQWRCGSERVQAVEIELMGDGSWECTVFGVSGTVQGAAKGLRCPGEAIKRATETIEHYVKGAKL